jgi:hypothetical protein
MLPRSRHLTWCKRLIYKRGCQQHFSPSAGGASLVRDIQPPYSPEKTLVWCRALEEETATWE